ncbi:MAG: SH3 domain-containing protein, partial [Candidatus Woesebacteria bacterium]|nr:SH3 domain-containing protein [Candidatus Woesebacteria bacterium]
PAPVERTYIEILSTPTGFLRVRSGPGATGSEIAQVKPGDRYLFLDEDVATGWVKIQYEAPAAGLPNGIEGWVSGQYIKKITK